MQTSGGIGTRSRTAGEWLAAARRYEREGELFQAYDIAMQGLARFPRDFPLKHRAVSCLASIHATAQALMVRAGAMIAGGADADYRALASTIGQLRLVVGANRLDPSVLAALTPPLVLHYCGHLIAAPGAPGRFPADRECRVRDQIERRLGPKGNGFAPGLAPAGARV